MVPNLPQLLQTFFGIGEVPVGKIGVHFFFDLQWIFSEDPAQERYGNKENEKY